MSHEDHPLHHPHARRAVRVIVPFLAALLASAAAVSAPVEATPPLAEQRPFMVTSPFGARPDPWYWLRDDKRADKDMLAYLEAENAYLGAVMAPHRALEDKLYGEIVGRIKQDDATVPQRQRRDVRDEGDDGCLGGLRRAHATAPQRQRPDVRDEGGDGCLSRAAADRAAARGARAPGVLQRPGGEERNAGKLRMGLGRAGPAHRLAFLAREGRPEASGRLACVGGTGGCGRGTGGRGSGGRGPHPGPHTRRRAGPHLLCAGKQRTDPLEGDPVPLRVPGRAAGVDGDAPRRRGGFAPGTPLGA